MVWFKAFLSGFLATLIFHQALLAVFFYAGMVPHAPYNMSPVPPMGVPSVISLAFFGGLWGMLLWLILARLGKAGFWLMAIVLGAVGPTAVAMLVVFPLKDIPVSAQTWVGGLILNGAWGLGLAVFLIMMGARRSKALL